jgi:hypothetical protein
MEYQLDATITVLLISKISSTCFGQTFAHLQECKTEIFFTTYGIMAEIFIQLGRSIKLLLLHRVGVLYYFTYIDDARSNTNQVYKVISLQTYYRP